MPVLDGMPGSRSPGESQAPTSTLMVLGKIAIAAAILVYLAHTQRMGFARLGQVLQHPLEVAGLLALLLVLALLLAVRWRLLLATQGYHPGFRSVLALTFMAIFFDSLLPGGTSDIVRGYYFDRAFQPQDRVRAASTVLVDRFLGLMALLLMGLVALSFYGREDNEHLPALRMVISALGAVFLLGFVFLCAGSDRGRGPLVRAVSRLRIGALCVELFDALRGYRRRRGALVQALLLAVAGHMLVIACFWAVGNFLGERHLVFTDYLFVVPVGLCVAQLPISPGGIGVGHAGFYSLFAMAGSRLGADLFSVYVVVHLISGLPGLVYWLMLRRVVPARTVATLAEGQEAPSSGNPSFVR